MKTLFLILTATLASGLPALAGNQYAVVADATTAGANSVRGSLAYSGGLFYGTTGGGMNGRGTLYHVTGKGSRPTWWDCGATGSAITAFFAKSETENSS